MRKSLLGLVLAAALLPVSMVHAGVKEDLAAGKSVEEIINQAKADGADIESVLGEIIANAPDKAYAAVAAAIAANPDKASKISNFAVSKGLDRATVQSIAANSNGGLFTGVTSGRSGNVGNFATNSFSSSSFNGGGGGGGSTTTQDTNPKPATRN